MRYLSLVVLVSLAMGCSGNPTKSDIEAAGGYEAYWRGVFERECQHSGVSPGGPVMVQCIDDKWEILQSESSE